MATKNKPAAKKREPMTVGEAGSKGGKAAWADLTEEERSAIWSARARKAWKTKRKKARQNKG